MHGAAKPRRRAGRWLLSNGSFSLVVAGILGGMVREVKAQEFTNGGTVSMTCESDCSCSGTSDDGTIKVLPNPSSEELVRKRESERATGKRSGPVVRKFYFLPRTTYYY